MESKECTYTMSAPEFKHKIDERATEPCTRLTSLHDTDPTESRTCQCQTSSYVFQVLEAKVESGARRYSRDALVFRQPMMKPAMYNNKTPPQARTRLARQQDALGAESNPGRTGKLDEWGRRIEKEELKELEIRSNV